MIPKAPEDDDFYHTKIKSHKYVQKIIEPEVGTHLMNCNGSLVHMNGTVNAMFFISKDTKYMNIDEKELMEIWNTNNDDEKQSYFVKPTKMKNIDLSEYDVIEDDTKKIKISINGPLSIRKYMDEKVVKYEKIKRDMSLTTFSKNKTLATIVKIMDEIGIDSLAGLKEVDLLDKVKNIELLEEIKMKGDKLYEYITLNNERYNITDLDIKEYMNV